MWFARPILGLGQGNLARGVKNATLTIGELKKAGATDVVV